MRVDKEAFVKRWWSKYQVQYALIESPVKRLEFLDRLLAQSKHVLFSDQVKSFIIEKREIARLERRQELFVSKNEVSANMSKNRIDGYQCILWLGEKSKIKLLAELLVDHNYILNSEKWLKHFDNNALAKANSDPIDWQKNTYELQYLIRDLKAKALITYPVSYERHFTIKGKPLKNLGGGIHDPTKLDKIKAMIIKIT